MPNDYITLTEFKAALPDTDWGSTYDAILTLLIRRASRMIDQAAQREAGAFYVSADTTRWFDGDGGQELWIGELAAAPTTLSVAEGGVVDSSAGTGGTYTAWAATDYLLWPSNALLEGRPYLRVEVDVNNGSKAYFYPYAKSVKIAGKFGYATVPPEDIRQAATVQTARWFKRGQQAFKDAGAITELGQMSYVQKLDPDVATIIEPYQRYVYAA